MIRRYGAILTLLTALNFMNYLDRFELAAVLPRVSADLHLSDFMGGLLSTVFLVSFLVTCPLFGYLGDRVPRKYLLAAGAFAWSAATIATGLSQGATGIIIARACVGVGEASFTTLAPTVIDDVAPLDRKARALSIFHIAAPVGAALGYLVGGAVEKAAGWHMAFFVGGGPGILLGMLVLLIEEPKATKESNEKAPASPGIGATLRAFGPLRSYWRAVFGYTALTFATGGFAFWAPTFLFRRYNMALAKANFTFGIITVVAGAVATLLGGRLGDRVMRTKERAESHEDPSAGYRDAARTIEAQEHEDDRRVRGLLRICGGGALVAAPLAFVCFLAPSATIFFAAAFFCEMGIFLSNAPVNTAILRAVPSHLRASAMAVCITTIHLLGDLWSPPLIGKLADFAGTGKMHIAMMPLAFAFGLAGFVWFNFGGARSRAR
ncbi:MAG: MFS transporter [Polyangiaceae bacterium]